MAVDKRHSICVVGAGHVGLVAAACFADLGNRVFCVDSDKKRIADLKKNIVPFFEPQLAKIVKKNVKNKRLKFDAVLGRCIADSGIIFIAVGTPPQEDGSADLSFIENVAQVVAKNLNNYKLIVGKSTVPVHTGTKIKETILRYRKNNVSFDVASNPEFLREGKAIHDFFCPDRIVIGVESKRAETILKEIYHPLKAPVVVTDINTAELIKHASNSFLAVKISFINAVSRVCDLAGADVKKVAYAMGLDKRIGKEFLDAGLGYGGFCFPKDLEAFVWISKRLGYDFSLLKEVKKINEDQKRYFVEKIKETIWIIKGKKIAVLGLSFKPDTDDLRFAPSISIVKAFVDEGAEVRLYDPQSMEEAKKIFQEKDVKFCKDAYGALVDCDCVCFLTEWEEFKSLDLRKIKRLMRFPFIADGRNMFDRGDCEDLGFQYVGMGR
ncbi:MAG: UDP-glucose/GDP-mannose dehydrogenase family protein [Candidatus Omnitrophota bacterium]